MSERWNFARDGQPPLGWEIIDDYVEDDDGERLEGWVWIDRVPRGRYDVDLDAPYLDIADLPDNRDLRQKPFKLPIDNASDLRHRLSSSVIRVKGNPYYVAYVEQQDVMNLWIKKPGMEKSLRVPYNHPHVDCRPYAPMYVQYNRFPGFLFRTAGRQQQQGLTSANTKLHSITGNHRYGRNIGFDEFDIIPALEDKSILSWDEKLCVFITKGIIPEVRLSQYIGAGFDENKTKVYHKGRVLGEVKDDTVMLDKRDMERPWIRRRLNEIGLKFREETAAQ